MRRWGAAWRPAWCSISITATLLTVRGLRCCVRFAGGAKRRGPGSPWRGRRVTAPRFSKSRGSPADSTLTPTLLAPSPPRASEPTDCRMKLSPVRQPLGQLLLGRGAVAPAQLESALVEQRRAAGRKLLGEILVESRLCSEEQI